MGGICSRTRRSPVDNATVNDSSAGCYPHVNGHSDNGSRALPMKLNNNSTPSSVVDNMDKQLRDPFSFPELNTAPYGLGADDINDGIPHLSRALSHKSRSTKSKQAAVAKVSEVSSLLGRAGTASLGKAVEVLDTLGSSMTNLNLNSGFTSGLTTKGNKISILAFEVANTIVKGSNLMQSLSKENIKHLKEVVLPSEGVKNLISGNMDELLRIAASDKREELKVFSGEVVRFGNRCKDPQWHNLDRYFEKLGSELTPQNQLKEDAETLMKELMTLVQHTAELYHELHALDRFEQDYRRRQQEEDNSNVTQRGESLAILRAELKSQRKHVKTLKKKSLWSKILEEVMEKLVDIVHFLHLEIHDAFGTADGDKPAKASQSNHEKLGTAGLALHYANIITQIDTLVSRSSSVPQNTRDALYQGLPPSIKSALRSKLQSFQIKEELTVPQIKAEMEKTLQWLVPIAANTTKAHHGFGWVGEWANTGSEVNRKPAGQTDLLRIETLHHADKEKTEAYILELVVWLHHLVNQARAGNGGIRSPVKSPIRSPNQKAIQSSTHKPNCASPTLTIEDQEMLRDVSKRKLTPGISKSQEFDTAKTRLNKHHRLSKSSSHSPTSEARKDPFPIRRPSSVPVINFDIDRIKALDVIDRVDTIRSI
ncbi:protein PSK SIMULATOR 1 [Ziziphus jujuba]|uniref:Protein PSK SIMULATOR 1 n=1 Tax=Ziziphus jujuba TaxID=326968 RepID=A0A6P4AKF8_ZIZJJ|nr:protein PSK SIMULATOR 1 [Ziziphus jujuba]XP_015886305.2 protein PSK SIMULATOR 1 [Ziziphus jujuba]XP_015886307.2 protein PSK SIMULATOR 1 [Ziziphus jujuba]